MDNLSFSLFQGSPQEEALLRSALIVNSVQRSVSRDMIMEKAIYGFILSTPSGLTKDAIKSQLNNVYKYIIDDNALDARLNDLYLKGLLKNYQEPFISKEDHSDFLNDFEQKSRNLIEGIFSVAQKYYVSTIPNPQIVRKFIREAIQTYYQRAGLELFNLQEKQSPMEMTINIQKITQSLGKNLGLAVIHAVADVLDSPNEEQKQTLLQLGRAFFTMQVMNLDPTLQALKHTELAQKSFVLDTDIVLHCICKMSHLYDSYIGLIKTLRNNRCKLFIPKEVVEEVSDHLDAAIKWGNYYGNQLLEFPDDMLENGAINNVFIEDFVKQHRAEKLNNGAVLSFGSYVNKYRNKNDENRLTALLGDVFGKDNVNRSLPQLNQEHVDTLQNLESLIYNKTIETSKAWKRTEEGNHKISEVDAKLYLLVAQMNSDQTLPNLFAYKTYIITKSTRTSDCAKQLGIYKQNLICNPISLMAMFEEVGLTEMPTSIEMFDNPYMAFVADQLWSKIDPIMQNHIAIKHQTFSSLQSDLNLQVDDLLTMSSNEDSNDLQLKTFSNKELVSGEILNKLKEHYETQIMQMQEKYEKLKTEQQKALSRKNHYDIKKINKKRTTKN